MNIAEGYCQPVDRRAASNLKDRKGTCLPQNEKREEGKLAKLTHKVCFGDNSQPQKWCIIKNRQQNLPKPRAL